MSDIFLIDEEIPLELQEGDAGDIEITVPDEFSMTDRTVKFGVFNDDGSQVFMKTTEDDPDPITIAGQVITIPGLAVKTEGKAGRYHWEIETGKTGEQPVTIGQGILTIRKTWIKNA